MSDPTVIIPAPVVVGTVPTPPATTAPTPEEAAAAALEAAKPAPAELPIAKPPVAPVVDETVYEYNPTGDAGLDVALQFIGERGFGPSHPAVKAATTGDFSQIEAALVKLGEKAKGYAAPLAAAKESAQRRLAASTAATEATQAAVIKAVGGVAEWNAIQKFASENADDTEKAQINAAFKAGGVAAVSTAEYLARVYKASGQSNAKPKQVVKPEASSAGATGAGPITEREFIDGFKDLQKKYGQRVTSSPEYAALVARRASR